jgi:hypothetical protein
MFELVRYDHLEMSACAIRLASAWRAAVFPRVSFSTLFHSKLSQA